MAIMQLKFDQDAISLDDFAKYDTALKRLYPNRRDNIQVGLDFGDVNIPLGKSTITSQSDAKLRARVYFSNDQKIKFELSEGTVSFTDERKYTSWDNFQEQAIRSIGVQGLGQQRIFLWRNSHFYLFFYYFCCFTFVKPNRHLFNSLYKCKAKNIF